MLAYIGWFILSVFMQAVKLAIVLFLYLELADYVCRLSVKLKGLRSRKKKEFRNKRSGRYKWGK